MYWHNWVEGALEVTKAITEMWSVYIRSDKATMPTRLVLMMMIIIIDISSMTISFMSVDQQQKSSDALSSEFWIHLT